MQMEYLWLKQWFALWYAESTFRGLIPPLSRTFISRSQQFHSPPLTLQMNISSKLSLSSPPWTQGRKRCGAEERAVQTKHPPSPHHPPSASLLGLGLRAVLEQGYFRVSKILATCVRLSITGATRISKKHASLPSLPGNQPPSHEGALTHDHVHLLSFPGKRTADDDERCESDEVL